MPRRLLLALLALVAAPLVLLGWVSLPILYATSVTPPCDNSKACYSHA